MSSWLCTCLHVCVCVCVCMCVCSMASTYVSWSLLSSFLCVVRDERSYKPSFKKAKDDDDNEDLNDANYDEVRDWLSL